MSLTPWFQSDIKPVRDGVYEREFGTGLVYYSYWNGEFWCLFGDSIKRAISYKRVKSVTQCLPWRGILK